MIRAAILTSLLIAPGSAEDAGWSGRYGGLDLSADGPAAFVGGMTEGGPAVLGLEIGAGIARTDYARGRLSVTGRLGAEAGGALLYGLAGVDRGGDGRAVVGLGATRRLGALRLGGELRQGIGGGEARLAGRVALAF